MITLENTYTCGWDAAIRGMRNPMNSWNKIDSVDEKLGPNDFKTAMNLISAGDDHAKFARFIDVYVDINAPLYFWKEFKTYRKGRTFMDDDDNLYDYDDDCVLEDNIEMNSCSTMHKIHEKEFTFADFSWEYTANCKLDDYERLKNLELRKLTMSCLNYYREKFLETEEPDKKRIYWYNMIQMLPSSYMQKRTVKMNYQVLRNMYMRRKNHKLNEWREFCKWVESLPNSELITGGRQV